MYNKIIYSKFLDPKDYSNLNVAYTLLRFFKEKYDNFLLEHEHRFWEYSMALDIIIANKGIRNILDVGCSFSLFPVVLAELGFDVTAIDKVDYSHMFKGFPNIKFINEDFMRVPLWRKYDFVCSISVIEHIEDYITFFDRLLMCSNMFVFLTTDCSIDGKAYSTNHLRTFTSDDLVGFINRSRIFGFDVYDGYDYDSYPGNFVYDYTFGSLLLKTKKWRELSYVK